MKLKQYVVDAFAAKLFQGNPAAVCLLDRWPLVDILQKIAMENNLSETAFLVPKGKEWDLRWFTPRREMELCGHATLASAYVLHNLEKKGRDEYRFHTLSGELIVKPDEDILEMNFPYDPYQKIENKPEYEHLFRTKIIEAAKGKFYFMMVVESEEDVLNCQPDYEALKALPLHACIITAPGKNSDFVSRFFAPSLGIIEDPVTGSAHCLLMTYWAEKLRNNNLIAHQLSDRGGVLECELKGERVFLRGKCQTYSEATLFIPD